MSLLLDTHVFLWYIVGDPRLPTAFRDAIRDPTNEVFLSVASVWEAVIKYGIGKLSLPGPPADYMPLQRRRHGIASLSIGEEALIYIAQLPPLHRDPFDRMIVGQALQLDLTIATVDAAILSYPVKSLLHS